MAGRSPWFAISGESATGLRWNRRVILIDSLKHGVPNGIRTRVTAVKGRFNALYIAGCFPIMLYFKRLFDVPFCSFFFCFVFLLQQNCNGKLE